MMFWRLALWVGFEKHSSPGVIGMISPRAYIAGPGHAGMRQRIRKQATDFWITDLGGDNRGARKSENIFEIETGVAIGICIKSLRPQKRLCRVRYVEVQGSAEDKLAALRSTQTPATSQSRLTLLQTAIPSSPAAAGAMPNGSKLTDIYFPWQHSGSQFKRLWPIAESSKVLEERWRRLLKDCHQDKRASRVY